MGFSGIDDLVNKLSSGKKTRFPISKTTQATTLVAGRVYDLSTLPGLPSFSGYGEHLINSYVPTNLFNWTPNGTGWAATNAFVKTSGTATTLTADSLNINIVSGRFYRVQYTVTGYASSNINFTLGGATGTLRSANGTYVEFITASSTAGFVLQASVNTGVFNVTNISVSEWGGLTSLTSAFNPLTDVNSPSVYHGGNVSPETKHFLSAGLTTNNTTAVGHILLVDLLGAYPYIDASSSSLQTLNNTNTLPRYTTGDGVRSMFVSRGTGYANNTSNMGAATPNIQMTYTNQSNVSSRQIPTTVSSTASSLIGQIMHSGPSAGNIFPLPLANTDYGIRSVQSCQLSVAGTAGTYCDLVLYRELGIIPIPTANVYFEREFVNMLPSLERIFDGAKIGLLYIAGGAAGTTTTFYGHIETGWG